MATTLSPCVEDYLKALASFRKEVSGAPLTEKDCTQIRLEWASLKPKQRRRWMEDLRTHSIIAGAAKTAALIRKN